MGLVRGPAFACCRLAGRSPRHNGRSALRPLKAKRYVKYNVPAAHVSKIVPELNFFNRLSAFSLPDVIELTAAVGYVVRTRFNRE